LNRADEGRSRIGGGGVFRYQTGQCKRAEEEVKRKTRRVLRAGVEKRQDFPSFWGSTDLSCLVRGDRDTTGRSREEEERDGRPPPCREQ